MRQLKPISDNNLERHQCDDFAVILHYMGEVKLNWHSLQNISGASESSLNDAPTKVVSQPLKSLLQT